MLLPPTCPAVSAYMPSILRRKAHSKTLRDVIVHTSILGFRTGPSSICLMLADFAPSHPFPVGVLAMELAHRIVASS